MPLERDINIAENGCSGFATSTQKGPFMAMMISRSRGTCLIESSIKLMSGFSSSRRWATTSQRPHLLLRPQTTLSRRRPRRSPRRPTTPLLERRPTTTSRGPPRPRPRRATRRARRGRGRARGAPQPLPPRTGASRTTGGRTSTRCNSHCHEKTGNQKQAWVLRVSYGVFQRFMEIKRRY